MPHNVMDIALLSQLTKNTVTLVLAGGRGSRLQGLSAERAKPAVHFGSRFRIIDFALSNCINSGLNRIGVITQYKAHSLLHHIQRGWSFLRHERNEFIELLPARQQLESSFWYRGTADAVYQNKSILQRHYRPKYIVILAGDHVYKMNYAKMLLDHVKSGAECTVGCIEVPRLQAQAFGVMATDAQYKITHFIEKPVDPPARPGDPTQSLASMGIYIFNSDYLYSILDAEQTRPHSTYDFGQDIIPLAVKAGIAYAHPFSRSCIGSTPDNHPYWRDVGTVDAYWEANIDLVSVQPRLDLFDEDWPIHSTHTLLAPTRFYQCDDHRPNSIKNALIAGGGVINSAHVFQSVLSAKVSIEPAASIDNCVLLPDVSVGRHSRLRRCVIDRGCAIPAGTVIGEDPVEDARRFHCTPNGVVLVTQRDMMCSSQHKQYHQQTALNHY